MLCMTITYFHYQFELSKTMIAKLSPQLQSSESQSNDATRTDSIAQFMWNLSAPQKSKRKRSFRSAVLLTQLGTPPKKAREIREASVSISIDHT